MSPAAAIVDSQFGISIRKANSSFQENSSFLVAVDNFMQFHRRSSTDVSIDCSVNETNNRGERKILQWPRLQQFQTRKNRKGKLREVPSGAAHRAASNGEDSLRTVPPYLALLRFSIFLSRVFFFFIVPTRHGKYDGSFVPRYVENVLSEIEKAWRRQSLLGIDSGATRNTQILRGFSKI